MNAAHELLSARILALIEAHGLDVYEVAIRAGRSRSDFHRRLHRELHADPRPLGLDDVDAICAALGEPVSRVLTGGPIIGASDRSVLAFVASAGSAGVGVASLSSVYPAAPGSLNRLAGQGLVTNTDGHAVVTGDGLASLHATSEDS